MLLQVRVRLADRPGSLGRVTWLLGALGVDIQQVVVLGRESGRAVDDFTVRLPGSVSRERMIATLEDVPGVLVDGVWPAAAALGASSDVAVLGQLAADPERGLAILVDASPRLFGAHWAALASGTGVLHASVDAPAEVLVPEPVRARAYRSDDGRHQYAMAPFGVDAGLVLVVARADAPGFHVAEVDRLIELVNAAQVVLADHTAALTSAAHPVS
ncbi:MAG: amino acid-binding protein [Micromonosporaceae bacterium]